MKNTKQRIVIAQFEINDDLNSSKGTLDQFEDAIQSNKGDKPIYLLNAIVDDGDEDECQWWRYISYLINWAMSHHDEMYTGMSPACFDEWCDNEDSDELVF